MLSNRFFASVGLVEPAGYHAIEVVLDDGVRQHFGGRNHLVVAFSPEAARETPDAELLTYGSPLLEAMAEAATAQGNTAHLYLKYLQTTTGRTLEKVRAHTRTPGHFIDAGEEQVLLFHHALFRFKASLIGEEREETLQDVMVDLHTGWVTLRLEEQTLRLYGSSKPEHGREMKVRLSLREAYLAALEKLRLAITAQVQTHKDALAAACQIEQRQVEEHYQGIIARLEAGKARKGSNLERIDDKIRATQADQAHRLQDVEKRYQLRVELTIRQLALVSYPKAVVMVHLQQGKETKTGVAIWDSIVHEGYFAVL